MGEASLESIADELYSLVPAEFTAARNSRAKADEALASQILALRKPSAAAWVTNLLVRHREAEVDEALDLGVELREAQSDLDRAELATLTRQRRQVVAALAQQGADLAAEFGQRIAPGVIEEVAQTLQAAMTDPHAADALRTGRLVRSLTTVGFEPVDLSGAVAAPGAGTPASRAARPRPSRPRRDDTSRRALDDARRTAQVAAQRARDAETAVEDIDRRMVRLGQRHDQLAEERDELEEQVRAVKADIASADREARTLDREHDRAAIEADRARSEADAAEAAVRDLER